MSDDVMRFDIEGDVCGPTIQPVKNGQYVLYEDYQQLASRLDEAEKLGALKGETISQQDELLNSYADRLDRALRAFIRFDLGLGDNDTALVRELEDALRGTGEAEPSSPPERVCTDLGAASSGLVDSDEPASKSRLKRLVVQTTGSGAEGPSATASVPDSTLGEGQAALASYVGFDLAQPGSDHTTYRCARCKAFVDNPMNHECGS